MRTTLPFRMKHSPSSAIRARARLEVSAKRLPRSMSHALDFTRSEESNDAVRDTYLAKRPQEQSSSVRRCSTCSEHGESAGTLLRKQEASEHTS